jgi:nicotinamidase/pyrazinamidase
MFSKATNERVNSMDSNPSPRLVLMDVDTQGDFMLPGGALARMPNVARIIPNLKRIFDYATENKLTILLATDAHTPDDPEFSTYNFPAHCVVGTPGQQRIPETTRMPTIVVPNRPDSFSPPLPQVEPLVVMVEKQHFSVGTNPNFSTLIAALGPCHIVATGVASGGCVKQSVLSLLELGVPVSIVVDAVGPDIQEEMGRAAIEELGKLGVRPVTTDYVCSGALVEELTNVSVA